MSLNPQFYANLLSGAYVGRNVKDRPEGYRAKQHEANATRLQKKRDEAKIKLAELTAKMSAIEEQMAGVQAPQPVQPMTQNENLISGGVGILASLLGARPQFVQGGLDAYRGAKMEGAGRQDAQNLSAYQSKLNALKAQLSGLGREAQMQQGVVGDLDSEYNAERGLAGRWDDASIDRANRVYDLGRSFDQQKELAELKSPAEIYQSVLAATGDPDIAAAIIAGKGMEAMGRGKYLEGKNAADTQNTNTRAKTSLEVARINAGSRENVASIGAQSRIDARNQGAIIDRMQGEFKETTAELADIRKEINKLDAHIRATRAKMAPARERLSAYQEEFVGASAERKKELGELISRIKEGLAAWQADLNESLVAKRTFISNANKIRGGEVRGEIRLPNIAPRDVPKGRSLRPLQVDPAMVHGLLGK